MKSHIHFTPQSLTSSIHKALRAWHTVGGGADDLLESLLLVRSQRSDLTAGDNPSLLRLATNKVLLAAINELKSQDQSGAQIIQSRFADDQTIVAVANQLNVSEHTVSRLQRQAIDRLAEIIFSQENQLRQTRIQTMAAHLSPPTYTRLFGVDERRIALVEQLVQMEAPWVIAVVGIGGIGKTALADAVARQIIHQFAFDEVIWLRTTPQPMSGRSAAPDFTFAALIKSLLNRLMPDAASAVSLDAQLVQVRQLLKERPYLIVIDNLEVESDTAYLLAHLSDLAQPTKFLLTTRTHQAAPTAVFTLPVDELSQSDAFSLIRSHAQDIGTSALETATEADFADIYAVTGGNPLALKLVVSLLDVLPLPRILQGLKKGQSGPIEDLYRHIYWQTWQVLSEPARMLLQAMPIVAGSGALPDYLQAASGLAEAQLWPAIQELRHRSLLEVRGTIQEKRYGIHRLTETFLRTEIIHWPEDENSPLNP